jgi:2-methylcitrate dehydratase PrpD
MRTQATVVFPSALAVAQDVKASGKEFLTACVVGYEFACRTGEFLGPTHYKVLSPVLLILSLSI